MLADGFTRRTFLARSAAAALSGPLIWDGAARAAMPLPAAANAGDATLDAYIAAYMTAMNAPGLTLGMTDAKGTVRTAGYGFADVERKIAVSGEHLFQIGSITKSFVALVILQQRDEGKLDLNKPVLDYLPELPTDCPFGPISAHHLLTHTSGLPDDLSVFSSDPAARMVQGFKPGEHFHYCNAGFAILGLLAAKLDGRTWRECVQARILTPLEMTQTVGVISTASRGRAAIGYQPFWDDEVYPRRGRLAPAPNLVMDDTAGCIASTPGDMAKYARMLANRGQGPHGRIVSEEGFAMMAKPYIKAPEFSETASYGYGIAVDTLDGHTVLRHTGGMVAFASSIHVDLDGGVAAFASINAMQGYRPTAVTEYAVRLLRAGREGKALPSAPEIADPMEVENAGDYAGTFSFDSELGITFKAEGKRLFAIPGDGKRVPLQHAGGDNFVSTAPGVFADHTFVFGRKSADRDGAKAEVVEVSYGERWYANERYSGETHFAVPAEYAVFAGRYQSDSAWGGDARVYVLKGQLMVDGTPLTRIGGRLFRAGEEAWMPDTAEFLRVFEGKARILRLSGMDFWRVEVD